MSANLLAKGAEPVRGKVCNDGLLGWHMFLILVN